MDRVNCCDKALESRRRRAANQCGLRDAEIEDAAERAASLVVERYPDGPPFFNDMCADTGLPVGWKELMRAAGLDPEPSSFSYDDNVVQLAQRDEAIFQLGRAVEKRARISNAAKWERDPATFRRSV